MLSRVRSREIRSFYWGTDFKSIVFVTICLRTALTPLRYFGIPGLRVTLRHQTMASVNT